MEDFDPSSLEEALNLLPELCRGCRYAQFMLKLAFDSPKGIAPYVEHLNENCSGYTGDPDRELDIPEGLMVLAGEYFFVGMAEELYYCPRLQIARDNLEERGWQV